MIQIDRAIPLPEDRQSNRYPFAEMEVGESFAVATAEVNTVRAAARYHAKKRLHKYVVRKVPGGYRLWRSR